MIDSTKQIPNDPCPALNKRLKVCGTKTPYGHKGCAKHPEGIGANKDLTISIAQARAWMVIDEFFVSPVEYKLALTYELYHDKKLVNDVVVTNVQTLAIARSLSEKIAHNLSMDKTILTYCLDRMICIFHLYDTGGWIPELNNRGNDINGFIPQHKFISYLIERIKLMTLLDSIEAVKYVLKAEYGYVNKFVKNTTNYDLLELDFKDTIVSPSKIKINRGDLPYNKLWHQTVKQNIPIGVVYKDDKFTVIDGYIRGISAMKIGSDKEYFILMS